MKLSDNIHRKKKELGQHFLKDKSVIHSIVNSYQLFSSPNTITDIERIIEIGPGLGALTDELMSISKQPLLLVEYDRDLVLYWEKKRDQMQRSAASLKIIEGDAASINWHQILTGYERQWVVSNLPYNASVAITRKLLEVPSVKWMTLMYQKEVAQKFLSTHGMSSLHYLFNCYFQVEKLVLVKPGAFSPPPDVDSMVLTFKRKDQPIFALTPQTILELEQVLRTIFAQPRKKIARLKKVFHTQLTNAPASHPLFLNFQQSFWDLRPQDLTFEQLTSLMELFTCHRALD